MTRPAFPAEQAAIEHGCADLGPDAEGWWHIHCACGLDLAPFPDSFTAVDALIYHALGDLATRTEQLEQALSVIPPPRLEVLADWVGLENTKAQRDLRRMALLARAALAGAKA